jgi:histidyl-tRNA synthetase
LSRTVDPFKGFKDKFGYDADVEDIVRNRISALARETGWKKYVPPVVERMATFNEEMTGWFGLSNRKFILGTIPSRKYEEETTTGILIPEGTASVCRFMAKQAIDDPQLDEKLPLKLFYTITCFRNEPDDEITETKLKAFGQVGFEYLGAKAPVPDIEIIQLAAESLRRLGIPIETMRIRLGDVGIFRKVSEGIDEKRKRYDIQQFLDGLSKERAVGSKQLAEQLSRDAVLALAPYASAKSINLLCERTGGSELIDELERELGLDLSYSRQITSALVAAGLPVLFDPAVVRGWSYYTGPVFQIDIVDDSIYPEVAGGGRYDILIGDFAKRYGIDVSMPATGFAFGAERLEELFKKYNPER